MAMTWEEIKEKYKAIQAMSCKPDMKRLPANYITDPDKSVNWNREQVLINHEAHHAMVVELNKKNNAEWNILLATIYEKIRQEVGHGFSKKSAAVLWDHVCHFYGDIDNRLEYLKDLIRLVKEVIENEK